MSFFLGDEAILKSERLTPADKLVYFTLVTFYNRKQQKAYPRIATIAKRASLSKRQVMRSIKILKDLKLIKTKRMQSTLEYNLPIQDHLYTTRYANLYNSDMPNCTSINKTKLIKPYRFYNNRFSNYPTTGGVARPLNKIKFNNIDLQYFATEGLFDEYRDKDGNVYTKSKLTNEIKKKTLNERLFIQAYRHLGNSRKV